jgi:hypothetical protein
MARSCDEGRRTALIEHLGRGAAGVTSLSTNRFRRKKDLLNDGLELWYEYHDRIEGFST